jgi:shikimate kinase
VLATGGGAYMNDGDARRHHAGRGISVWLKAELPLLMKRVLKRRGDTGRCSRTTTRGRDARLMETRYPVYAEADLTWKAATCRTSRW